MRRYRILLASALVYLVAAPPAAANGTLQFWEDTRGAPGVTAGFPTGAAQTAHIFFDADTAETGGLFGIVSRIRIEPTGSVEFVDFDCHFPGCGQNDYNFVPGSAADNARVVVDDTVDMDEKHGIWDVGVITFNADQEPGTIELNGCGYVTLPPDYEQRECTPFTLVTLPEPGALAALLSGAGLLFPLRRLRVR